MGNCQEEEEKGQRKGHHTEQEEDAKSSSFLHDLCLAVSSKIQPDRIIFLVQLLEQPIREDPSSTEEPMEESLAMMHASYINIIEPLMSQALTTMSSMHSGLLTQPLELPLILDQPLSYFDSTPSLEPDALYTLQDNSNTTRTWSMINP